ncbi:hypothetical protein [Kocuria turfanensis]|uniref:Uncharacterized protein n=1 Tax=Kocuria turfanensis TaxID=388357 RepID=A0A512IGV7_9MICC|nr:hypothetical protein [Kocuria turfanensis]GEO96945.1 hypothetical protein KTU01_30680 [Kocuria turfanensis]
MTTAPSIHSASTPPAPPAPQEVDGTVRAFRTRTTGRTRPDVSPAGDLRRPERERPEDDEAVITAVLATVTHRSFRERPEDDEVVLTYTSEPACPHTR